MGSQVSPRSPPRAAHLIVDDEPRIFADTLAADLLGDRAEELIGFHTLHGAHPVLAGARVQVTCRSRYTEEALGRAVGGGVTQYVVLGAGLDSFAYRGRTAGRVRVFEVDHAATQDWKRRALAAAKVAVPDDVTFIPADLADLARQAGFARVRNVRQRDTIPAGLWRRSDSLRPADLAAVFHGVAR